MEGWFKVHRKLLDDPLWLDEAFTRGQAWIDLIGLANHDSGYIRVRGNRVELNRGQVGWSELRLSYRWKWSRDKLRGFMADLINDHRIIQQKTFVTSVITILNYNKYQGNHTADQTANTTADQTADQTAEHTLTRMIKNEEKEKNEDIPTTQKSPGQPKKQRVFLEANDRPMDVPEDVWVQFLAIRRAKKSPLSSVALAGIKREADKAKFSVAQALTMCIERGWQGFKADWVNKDSLFSATPSEPIRGSDGLTPIERYRKQQGGV